MHASLAVQSCSFSSKLRTNKIFGPCLSVQVLTSDFTISGKGLVRTTTKTRQHPYGVLHYDIDTSSLQGLSEIPQINKLYILLTRFRL